MRIIRFQRLLRDVQPLPRSGKRTRTSWLERMGLGCRPSVCLVPGRVPPMLWAIGGRPRLLVPSQLWINAGAGRANVAFAPRVGAPEAARSLGPLARIGRGWAVLVAPGRLVGSSRACARPRNSAATPGSSGRCPRKPIPMQPPCWQPLSLSLEPQPPRPRRRPPAAAGMFPA